MFIGDADWVSTFKSYFKDRTAILWWIEFNVDSLSFYDDDTQDKIDRYKKCFGIDLNEVMGLDELQFYKDYWHYMDLSHVDIELPEDFPKDTPEYITNNFFKLIILNHNDDIYWDIKFDEEYEKPRFILGTTDSEKYIDCLSMYEIIKLRNIFISSHIMADIEKYEGGIESNKIKQQYDLAIEIYEKKIAKYRRESIMFNLIKE